jgi:L-seryl-tRNA(Ser) seleniumtransferase
VSEVQGNPLNTLLARVPAVERVMSCAAVQPLIAQYGRTQVLAAVRAALDSLRHDLQAGEFQIESGAAAHATTGITPSRKAPVEADRAPCEKA